MSLIRADIPTIVIGMKDIGFANAGINSYNTYKIIKIADPFESFNPLDPINAITGFEKDAAYFFFAKETIDLTGIADNAVPVNLDTTSGNNVFANMAFAGVAKTTASFATVGFNTSNLLWIYKVSDPYESYNPNDPYNPIDGFEVNECYYGYALADMDLNAYLIPPIVIKDDVEKATDTYKYWGTDATTDKDFYNVPVRFFADEASRPATGIENIVYVAKAEKSSWYWDGSAYQQIGGGTGGGSQDLQSVTDIGNTTTNQIIASADGIGASTVDTKGFKLKNNTPATSVLNQSSPAILWGGNAWGSTAATSQDVSFRAWMLAQAGTTGIGILKIQSSYNGGAWTDIMQIAQNSVTFTPNIFGGSAILSGFVGALYAKLSELGTISTPGAGSGLLYAKNDGHVWYKNSAGTDFDLTGSTGGTYTDEQAQDATAALFAAGTHTGITFTYDDAGNKISAAVTATGGTETDPLSVHLTGTSTATGDMTLDLGTTNEFNVTGNQANNTIVNITNSNATNSSAIKGISSGSGQGFTGVSSSGIGASGTSTSNTGVSGTSTSAKGVHGKSTSNYGVYAQTNTGIALTASNFSATTNASDEMFRIDRGSSGTAANGIGGYISYFIKSSDGFGYEAARIGAIWSNATTLNRTGELGFFTTTSGAASATKKMTLKGDGTLNITVAEYTDNAAAIAGGLAVGDIYRTGDNLKIVH
jgi:hypothetical protein